MNGQRPGLLLLSGQKLTAENLAKMFKLLTGRDALP